MKFTIEVSCVSYLTAEVEADSFDEAREIYEDMDGGDFEDTGLGDWRLYAITCEDTGEAIDYSPVS